MIYHFRLIKAYSLNLKSKNGMYEDKVTFEQIVELYLFNANFRQIIFPEIEKIEINVRCRIANYFAEQYGILGYLEADNYEGGNLPIYALVEVLKNMLCLCFWIRTLKVIL